MKTRILIAALVLAIFALVVTRPPAERLARAQGQSGGYLPRGTAWNVGALTSGASVFASPLTLTQAASAVRISVTLGSGVPLGIVWSDAGGHTFTSWLNSGSNLGVSQGFTFTFGARNSRAPGGITAGTGTDPIKFNFVVGGPTTVPILWCEEITTGVD